MVRFDKISSGVIFGQFIGSKCLHSYIIFNANLKNSETQLFIATNIYKIQIIFIIQNFQKKKVVVATFIIFSHFLENLVNLHINLSQLRPIFNENWQKQASFLDVSIIKNMSAFCWHLCFAYPLMSGQNLLKTHHCAVVD